MDKKNKDVLHHVNHTHREFDKEDIGVTDLASIR